MCTGFEGTPLLSGTLDEGQLERVTQVLAALGIEELADRHILSMSQGEAKKILIARALVKNPKYLFLDEIYTGLDARSKDTLAKLLDRVIEQGTQILWAAHNAEQMPAFVTHILTLRSGRIMEQCAVEDMSTRVIACSKSKSNVPPAKATESPTQKPTLTH